jgi:hypothetical protein
MAAINTPDKNENDLPGPQDQGGKHGGQKGMPEPTPSPKQQQQSKSPTGQRNGDGKFGGPHTPVAPPRAFSSEVGTGSREENASNQKARARLRFNQKLTRSKLAGE